MSDWHIKTIRNTQLKNPILIEGLPGVGNVGKIAVDFLIEALNATKVMEITSPHLPHCVFVNEENLVELPAIEIYHKRIKGLDLLFLAGDSQPNDEESCYDFCHTVLDTFEKTQGKEIVTLGGIAMAQIPKDPKVYCTGNSKELIKKYSKTNHVNTQVHGLVGPIVGVSGLLTGLAGKRKIPAVSLLAETFGHPNYIGVQGAKELIEVLRKRLALQVKLDELEQEAIEIEKSQEQLQKVSRAIKRKQQTSFSPLDYIG